MLKMAFYLKHHIQPSMANMLVSEGFRLIREPAKTAEDGTEKSEWSEPRLRFKEVTKKNNEMEGH